jgi:hypothetical protein
VVEDVRRCCRPPRRAWSVLVFWNARCGFCEQLLADLLEWERRRRERNPELVVIATGSVGSVREPGSTSRELLDDAFATGPRLAAHGTPMAVLGDRDVRIASDLAVCGPKVLGLAEAPGWRWCRTASPGEGSRRRKVACVPCN